MQFLTDRTLKRSCQQSKSVILNLLQGCYNIPMKKAEIKPYCNNQIIDIYWIYKMSQNCNQNEKISQST